MDFNEQGLKSGLPTTRIIVLVAGAFIPLAFLAGILVSPDSVPNELLPPESPARIELVHSPFDDSRTVELDLIQSEERAVLSPTSGILTHIDCSTNGSWNSGTAPLSIDGSPILVLFTEIPLWRDLVGGERGDDVGSLQKELSRLGQSVEHTSLYDRQTRRAVERVFESVGRVKTQSVMRTTYAWLPSPQVLVSSCLGELGGAVGPGIEVAAIAPSLLRVTPKTIPTDLIEGDREIQFQGESYPSDGLGGISDPLLLARLESSPVITQARFSGTTIPIKASFSLSVPIEAYLAPPSSIVNIRNSVGCVFSEDEGFPVQILSSTLGRTLLVFQGPAPRTIVVSPENGQQCI